MNHDPKEHFSEEQIAVIDNIFTSKLNATLLKGIGAYVITLLLAVMAVGAGWYRLGNVEEGLKDVTATVHGALPSKEYVDSQDANIQMQITGTNARLDRIEDKLDVIINKI